MSKEIFHIPSEYVSCFKIKFTWFDKGMSGNKTELGPSSKSTVLNLEKCTLHLCILNFPKLTAKEGNLPEVREGDPLMLGYIRGNRPNIFSLNHSISNLAFLKLADSANSIWHWDPDPTRPL